MTKMLDGPRLDPLRGPARHLIVLCHGYGAGGNDLMALAQEWQRHFPDTAFAAPHAPERCAQVPQGFQWFDLTRFDPHAMAAGVEGATPALNAFLDSESARWGVPPERLALAGFSQGTMMALHVGLRRQILPQAIVGFSGLLVAPDRLPPLAAAPPILLLHGDSDPVIPDAAMFASAIALGAAGAGVQWHRSLGLGHGIGADGMALAGQFLSLAFAGRLAARDFPLGCRLAR